MKKLFLPLLLCLSFCAIAWQGDSTTRFPDKKDSPVIIESFNDSKLSEEDAKRNIDNILALQKERRDKQKKAAFIRIAIGVGLLVVLVIGLRRRKRITNKNNE